MSPPRWLAILGIGEDGVEGLSPSARTLLASASLVVGGGRHLSLAAPLIRGEVLAWPHPISDAYPAILRARGRPVAVLASGDPYCYGIGAALAQLVPAEETTCLPAPSAFSLACARLGWALHETTTLSFCGRPLEALVPHLQPGARVLALSADAATPAAIAALLCGRGFGSSRLHVLEALGGPRERIRAVTAEAALPGDIDPLNLVAIEVAAGPGARVLPLAAGLPDALFEHDGQITRREVRAITLAALAPTQGAMLWDVGCGSGSIGIEWMLRHPANRAIGMEPRADRAARAARNAAALGVSALRIVQGRAPDVLKKLDPPDAVFIGGGARETCVIRTAWAALRPGGCIVANAVTIETEVALVEAQRSLGGTLTRIAIERLDRIGRLHGYRPAMTVTQWAAQKP